MAQLIGYTVANGGQAVDFNYEATVTQQWEIEEHRQKLLKDLDTNYNVWFHLRKPMDSPLQP